MKGLAINAVRWFRDIRRPAWNIRLGRYAIWQHLSRLYSLPMARQSAHLSWEHTSCFPKGFSGRLEYLAGNYEPELTQLVKERVRQGMTGGDKEANTGYHMLLKVTLHYHPPDGGDLVCTRSPEELTKQLQTYTVQMR